MKSKRVLMQIDAELYQRLKECAAATDAPVTRIVARGLTSIAKVLHCQMHPAEGRANSG